MTPQSPSPPKTIRTTVRKLIKKMKPAQEEPMPGELDSTEVQLARFFAKPAPAPNPIASPSMRREQASSPTSSSSLSPASSTSSAASSSSSRGPIADVARRRAPFSSDTASDGFGMVQGRAGIKG